MKQLAYLGFLAYGFLAEYKNCYILVSQLIKQAISGRSLAHIIESISLLINVLISVLSLNVCKNVHLTTVDLLLFGTNPFSTQQLHHPSLLA